MKRRPAARLTLLYALFGALWILATDGIVDALLPEAARVMAQTVKGLLYVSVTTALVYWLARRAWERTERHLQELREAEQQARRSETRYRALIDSCPLAVVSLDTEARVRVWNDAAEEIFGWSREEVLGERLPFVPAERREESERLFARVLDGEALSGVELIRERQDGSPVSISLSTASVIDDGEVTGVMAVIEDITEREHRLEQLEQTRRMLERAERLARVGSWSWDLETDTVSWSEQVYRIFGLDPDEDAPNYAGHPDLIEPESMAAINEGVERTIATGRGYDLEARVRRPDGETRRCRVIGRAETDSDGKVVRLFGSVQDITRQARLEEQLQRAQRLESIGRLAGGVAHDFNNMLTIIRGHVDLMLERPDMEPVRSDLEEIRTAAKRSAELTGQLLSFARQQVVEPQVIELDDAIERRLGMLRRLIGENLELTWEPAEQEARVRIDPGQIDQILTNLIVNARDAIEDVGRIEVKAAVVELDEEACADNPEALPGRYVMVSVTDDGVGMDAATQAHIFEPFFTTRPEDKGTGLGLSTVYGIVRQNEGFIEVESEPGEGSAFRVYLPIVADEAEPEHPSAPKVEGGSETVLVVEDEPALLRLTERFLVRLGYTVRTAATPEEAIALARDGDEFDLLITDVVLPQMNGRELCEKLGGDCDGIRCLFMSGYSDDAIASRGVLEEGVHFLQKPFTSQELGAKVRDVLGR